MSLLKLVLLVQETSRAPFCNAHVSRIALRLVPKCYALEDNINLTAITANYLHALAASVRQTSGIITNQEGIVTDNP